MKRWHVFAPSVGVAKEIYVDMTARGFDPAHIHVFARDKDALAAAGIPPTTEMEEAMVGGRGIGPLLAGLMGTTPPDPVVQEAEKELEAGQVVFVVGFPDDDADRLRAIIKSHGQARSPEVGPELS